MGVGDLLNTVSVAFVGEGSECAGWSEVSMEGV